MRRVGQNVAYLGLIGLAAWAWLDWHDLGALLLLLLFAQLVAITFVLTDIRDGQPATARHRHRSKRGAP